MNISFNWLKNYVDTTLSAEMTALLMAIYLALDGYGPACNVSGDGAIAVVMDKLFGKKAISK